MRIVGLIRARWSRVKIVIRADSGFCRDAIMTWCEANGVDYLLGLAKNSRLIGAIGSAMAEAQAAYRETGTSARVFAEFAYRTLDSWSRMRRVIAKAEHLDKGANPRFVVTSLEGDAKALYEEVYCARGEMENRIKEQSASRRICRPHQRRIDARQSDPPEAPEDRRAGAHHRSKSLGLPRRRMPLSGTLRARL